MLVRPVIVNAASLHHFHDGVLEILMLFQMILLGLGSFACFLESSESHDPVAYFPPEIPLVIFAKYLLSISSTYILVSYSWCANFDNRSESLISYANVKK